MTTFDPSAIQDIAGNMPDIPGAMAKGFQLKDLADEGQLRQLNLTSKRSEVEDQQKRKQIMSSADVSTPKGLAETSEKLNRAGLAQDAMDLRKFGQSVASGEWQQKQQMLELHSSAQNIIEEKLNGIWGQANAMREAKTPDGRPKYNEAAINAQIQARVLAEVGDVQNDPSIPDDVKKIALSGVNKTLAPNGGRITFDELTAYEQNSNKGRAQIEALLKQHNISSEIEHRGVEEKQNQERIDIARANSQRQSGNATLDSMYAAFGEAGIPIPGRSKQTQDASMRGLMKKYPDLTADEIAKGVRDGQLSYAAEKKEVTTAAGIAGRVSVGENELIDFAPKAIAISNKVSRGDFVPFNRLQQMGERNISNPDLKELYGRTNAILNAYDVVAARGGTDKDKRAENRRNLETADSPAAYKRAVETMMDEARIAKRAARKAEGRESETGGNTPPPRALQSLKEGVHTTFGNGQTWTLQGGKPIQVQ
jgi:hypothetical protein